MVAVVRPEQLAAVEEVCDRWELAHAPIGEVTDTGELRAYFEGELVGAIPAALLTDEAPRYEVPGSRGPGRARSDADGPVDGAGLLDLLASPNLRSRAWIYRRYDQLVGSRTVRRPGLDAAVLRLRPSLSRPCRLPRRHRPHRAARPAHGGALAVLEAARNVACAGGEPLAITDCLNFGNPEKPEIAWELAEAIEGMAAACEALGIPVVSGNVSLYNETDGRAIHPTPVVGCVGSCRTCARSPRTWREGDAIYLAGARASLRRLGVPGAVRRARPGARPLSTSRRGRARSPLHETRPGARSSTTSPRAGSRSRSPRRDRERHRRRARPARRRADALRRGRRPGDSASARSSTSRASARSGRATLLGVPIAHLRQA